MNDYGFTSAFASHLNEYLAFKKNMGCYGQSRICYLKRFDSYSVAHDCTVFDRGTVEGWVRSQLERSSRYRSWMSYIRDFGRWLRAHGDENAYVLPGQWKAPFVRACPHLFSSHEVERFFVAAAHLKARSPWQWQAVAFFTLLHSCGIRTGEARALLVDQVDLDGAHLEIHWSKGNRSRRLPLTDQVVEILAACEQRSREEFGPSRRTFFISAAGSKLTGSSVGIVFNRIWEQAGLPRPSQDSQPRPYGFRHHFAYANIERWMAQDKDVTALLPYLTRYLGHATFESTYYYIHTSPDFMSAYAHLTQRSATMLPPVGFE